MASIGMMLKQGMPTSGNVNAAAPFSFGAQSQVGADYAGKPNVNALMRPTLHNSVPESMVNPTASVPIFVRPFAEGFEKGYSEGDILFVRRETAHRSKSMHHVVANLPVLNYMLRNELRHVDDTREGYDERKYQTLEDVLEDWNYFGILNTDMDTGSKWQRLLNINVRGRSRVARLWKPPHLKGRLEKGTCLFLGFFKETHDNNPRLPLPNSSSEEVVESTTGRKGEYFQVRATLDCSDDTTDLKNAFHLAEYVIPVGIVSQVTLKSPNNSSIKNGHYNTEACKSLERIEVLMRI
jgi:hypothetical protein